MKILKETILEPLQLISGVVDNNKSNQILSTILFKIIEDDLYLIGSNLDTEIRAKVSNLKIDNNLNNIAVPGKKFLDICKSLPSASNLEIKILENNKIQISAEGSNFSLPVITGENFPLIDDAEESCEFFISSKELKKIISQSYFSMAQNDVRIYLVGMLWEITNKKFRAVASDGHRLSISEKNDGDFGTNIERNKNLIIPRKSILELLKILSDKNEKTKIFFSSSYLKIVGAEYIFYSKLINSRYPGYESLMPKEFSMKVPVLRDELKTILQRVAILSNEKSRAVRLTLDENILKLSANNRDTEHAEGSISLKDKFSQFEICFNYQYMLDVLSVISGEIVNLNFLDNNKPILVTGEGIDASLKYLIMPMRI